MVLSEPRDQSFFVAPIKLDLPIFWRRDNQQDDTEHNDTLHNDIEYHNTQHHNTQHNNIQHNDTHIGSDISIKSLKRKT